MLASVQRPRVAHATAPALIAHHQGFVFLPGAENIAYEPAAWYPYMELAVNISGNGCVAGAAPNPYQLPQVYVDQAIQVRGIGGVLAGQFIGGQPLQIPDTTNGTQ